MAKKVDTRKIFNHWQAVPLKSSFMVTAMLGFLISVYWVYPQSSNYGITFIIVFVIMFTAALISMTKAPIMTRGGKLK